MPTITVTVHRQGKPMKGCQVSLGCDPSDKVYGPEYTGNDGVARFEVKDGEGGEVLVNTSLQGHWEARGRTDIAVNV